MSKGNEVEQLAQQAQASANGRGSVPRHLGRLTAVPWGLPAVAAPLALGALALVALAVRQRLGVTPAAKPVAKPAGRLQGVAGRLQGAVHKPLSAARKPLSAARKPQGAAHKPSNKMRYYGLGLLIRALEHDTTRKGVIALLKLAQRRS